MGDKIKYKSDILKKDPEVIKYLKEVKRIAKQFNFLYVEHSDVEPEVLHTYIHHPSGNVLKIMSVGIWLSGFKLDNYIKLIPTRCTLASALSINKDIRDIDSFTLSPPMMKLLDRLEKFNYNVYNTDSEIDKINMSVVEAIL